MRRRTLGVVGALLLWLALWCAAGSALAAPEAPLPPPPASLAAVGELPLDGRTVYWLDASGALTAEQVLARGQELPWRVRHRDRQSALHGGVLWILFDAVVPAGETWYLEVSSAINDRVDLFYRDASGALVRQEAGTAVPESHWTLPGRLPTFQLARDHAKTVRYLLRVEDDRADFVAPLSLLRQDVLQQHREREQFLFGAYFGLLALIAVASLANGILFRDRAFLGLALYIALLALGQVARIGVGAQHLWSDWQVWNDAMMGLWPGAATAAALWTIKIVTDPARLSRALDLAVWALIAALLAATAVHVALDTRTTLVLVLWLTGIAIMGGFSMVMWGWLAGKDRVLRLVVLAFVPLGVLALFPLARGLGFAPASLLSRFGVFYGTLIELPILYYALNSRLMLRQETELRAGALSRTDPLTGLAHRGALVERLDSSLAHARAQKQNCALLGIRISNLDAIAQEYGRDAVDKALVVAASHLRRACAGYDMPARVGEREFALLVEAPATRETATSRAQQVVASGLRPMESLPGATLRFHVTVGILPRRHLDGAAALHWVLDALDSITPDARKLIRSLDTIQ
jgi:two-component system, sensor histidine kinase LadS